MCLSADGHPIYYRPGTTDTDVINDILVREEYACVAHDVRDPRLIIDGGAYAGYSALFFLMRYKNAHVIAVEPDDQNFALCKLNLEPYQDRVTLLQAAIWSDGAGLVLHRGELADGREWATMVQPPKAGETADVRGVDIGQLLRDSGYETIDLLKLNIECSELHVFSRNSESWLPHVSHMIVQLHDEHAENAFFEAMAEYQFLLSRPPTLFACTHIGPRKTSAATERSKGNHNALENASFENPRVESARIVPGNWIAGSTDIAQAWHVVVCDPQFHVSLAIRTGKQHSGGNALFVRLNANESVQPGAAPYIAVRNRAELSAQAGESWRMSAFVNTLGAGGRALTQGAYFFMRLMYDDGSSEDLRTEPLMEQSGEYVERSGIVQIPPTPLGRTLISSTLWLYAWIANAGTEVASTDAHEPWEVLFDDVACTKI